MSSWLDYTINGLIVGNVYALVAVGLALIFGVSRLINFAQGSIYLVGAYIGWVAVVQLRTPLVVTMLLVAAVAALVGLIIERFGLRPLQNSVRIAPLLATIGISFVLDQLVMLTFSPNPRALPSQLPDVRFQIGTGTIGPLDLLIAGVGITSALLLFVFLRYSKLGWAVRATAQDRDAAMQMGVDVNRVNQAVFGIAAALGGVSGMLVGMYYNQIDTAMSLQATLKGVVAEVVGGAGNVPGAVVGSLLLGLVESYGVAVFGTSYRNLFAFLLLIVVLVLRPNGLFASARQAPPEPLTGTFIAPSRPVRIPRWALADRGRRFRAAAVASGLVLCAADADQRVAARHAGAQPDAGRRHGRSGLARTCRAACDRRLYLRAAVAAFVGSGRPRHHLRRPDERGARHAPDLAVVPPARALRLDRDARDRRDRVAGHPELGNRHERTDRDFRHPAVVAVRLRTDRARRRSTGSASRSWFCWRCCRRGCSASHLGRSFRAIRDDDVAARAYGLGLNRYKALAFIFGGFAAGVSGGIAAHLYSYINHETFNTQQSILALTVVILGGLGNVAGAIVGSVALVGLPEVFRIAAEYRILIYGIVLLLLVRFRPQGLLGTI